MSTLGGIEITQEGIGHILSDVRVCVPIYQRAYSWSKSHIETLFEDLTRAIDEGGREYFLGSIVACATSEKITEIVDGQQRLATITVLIAAVRDHLVTIGSEDVANTLERDFLKRDVGMVDPQVHPRLTLSEADNDFFIHAILDKPTAERATIKPQASSHRLLRTAHQLAAKKIANELAGRSNKRDQIAKLEQWIEFLRDKARVVFIKVPDHADAFVIFETLNDRGLELSIADLAKNYLFGRSGERIEETKKSWNRMVGVLQSVSDRDITRHYIHTLWSSKKGVTRNRDLFKRMKSEIHTEQHAVTFANELSVSAQNYAALRNADHEYWNQIGPNARHNIRILSNLRVAQVRMLLLAVLDSFSPTEIRKVLKSSVCWSVRFMIGGEATGNLESFYAQRAVLVRKMEIKNAKELNKSMAQVLPNDEVFRAAFASESVSNERLARYYLACLEKAHRNEGDPHLGVDNDAIGSLEHILPKNADLSLWEMNQEDVDELKFRIGNLALLAPEENAKRGNGSFADAKPIYEKSTFELTKEITEIGSGKTWGRDQISLRQGSMAYLAVRAWPID